MKPGRLLLVACALLAACAAPAAQPAAPELLAAERALRLLEDRVGGDLPDSVRYGAPSQATIDAARALPATARALDAYLAKHPADARALVVRARLLREQYLASDFDSGVKLPPEDVDPRDEVLRLVDRALAIDSTRADAYYTRALTLASPILLTRDGPGGPRSVRFEDALPPARTAHRLAPDDTLTVDLLEHCLILTGRDLEAEALRAPPTSGEPTPVRRTLERRARMPVPPGLHATPHMRESFGNAVGRGLSNPTPAARYARITAYMTDSVSVDGMLDFYRRTWPAMTWVDQQVDRDSSGFLPVTRSAMTFFRWNAPGEWTPTEAGSDPFGGTGTIMLWIQEIDYGAYRDMLPDSLRDEPLPTIRTLMLFDRVEDQR